MCIQHNFDPQIPVLKGDIRDQPGVITADYVRAAAMFGPITEVRAGYRSVLNYKKFCNIFQHIKVVPTTYDDKLRDVTC